MWRTGRPACRLEFVVRPPLGVRPSSGSGKPNAGGDPQRIEAVRKQISARRLMDQFTRRVVGFAVQGGAAG